MSKELETAKKIYRETKNTEVANALLSVFGSQLVELKFNPDAIKWVDLGLPSGRLWASENIDGYYTYDQAVELFGEYLPKGVAFAELIEECKVEWNPYTKGLDVTGPNGNSIFLPACGYKGEKCCRFVGDEGNYWSRMPYANSESFAPDSQTHARYLYFFSGYVSPLDNTLRSLGFSVRPSRELN